MVLTISGGSTIRQEIELFRQRLATSGPKFATAIETYARHPRTKQKPRPDVAELARLVGLHAPYDDIFPLRVPGIDALRASHVASQPTHALQQASVCIVAQGAKKIGLGDSIHEYGAAQIAVFSIDIPVWAQITHATPEEPSLTLRIALTSLAAGVLSVVCTCVSRGQAPRRRPWHAKSASCIAKLSAVPWVNEHPDASPALTAAASGRLGRLSRQNHPFK